MNNFDNNLKKYARLLVKSGINIQEGQTLVINAPIHGDYFVRILAEEAYKSGAKNVHVEYNDEKLSLIKYMNAPDEAFKEYPKWKADGYADMAREDYAFLSLSSSDPDLFKDVDPQRIANANKAYGEAMAVFRKHISNSVNSWCVAAMPSKEWSQKVFPDLSEEDAMNKLWDNIFKATRANEEDPVKAWDKHLDNLNRKLDFLNNNRIKTLHYKAKGTDLQVELPRDYIWMGGGEDNSKGVYFIANMPTEEVFTLPLKTGVNGYVTSTKPLSYGGNLIDDFTLTFKDGKVVDFTAKEGYETLKNLIETDKGSAYLGEVALVPHDSPVSNTDIIFFNTLFDENASCHFALGSAYPTNLKGGADMDQDELDANGVNTSITHVDFMVGSKELDIEATMEDGSKIMIFEKGDWAF